jgi:hypothetical protein
MLLEVLVLSGVYTIGMYIKYNAEKLLLDKGETVGDDVKVEQTEHPEEVPQKFLELSKSESEYNPPFYVGTNTPIAVPVGGGTELTLKKILTAATGKSTNLYHWTITDFHHSPSQKYWLNTPEDLQNFFSSNGIPQNILPLSLPLRVREISPVKAPVFRIQHGAIIGTSKKSVIETFVHRRTIGRQSWFVSAIVFGVSAAVVWQDWDNWHGKNRREEFARRYGFSGKTS